MFQEDQTIADFEKSAKSTDAITLDLFLSPEPSQNARYDDVQQEVPELQDLIPEIEDQKERDEDPDREGVEQREQPLQPEATGPQL